MSEQTQYPTPTAHTHNLYQRAQANGDEQMQSHLVETFGPDAFSPKSPFDAIKTVEDALAFLGEVEATTPNHVLGRSPSIKRANAYYKADTIARALNRIANGGEEWEAVADSLRWYVYIAKDGETIAENSHGFAIGQISFATQEAAQYFIDNFSSLITALK